MSATATKIAAGLGWEASDVVCSASPGDPAIAEEHRAICVALVTEGMFGYRTRQGDALMTPGALLLGNARACYECGHDHAAGDRCLSFHFSGAFHESVLASLPGARRPGFRAARVPPTARLARLAADARAAREEADAETLGEVALRLAGAAATLDAELDMPRSPGLGEARRIVRAIRRVEHEPEARLGLDDLAAEARMRSLPLPAHLLRSGRNDTAPIRPEDPARARCRPPAPWGRQGLRHRAGCRVQRSLDLQPAVSQADGGDAARMAADAPGPLRRQSGEAEAARLDDAGAGDSPVCGGGFPPVRRPFFSRPAPSFRASSAAPSK